MDRLKGRPCDSCNHKKQKSQFREGCRRFYLCEVHEPKAVRCAPENRFPKTKESNEESKEKDIEETEDTDENNNESPEENEL